MYSSNDLWSYMLVQWSDKYPYVLRLAAFLLLLAIDTSECERVFSLMNNIKSAHRAHVNQVACSTSIMGANVVTFTGLTPHCPPHGL